MSEVPLYTAGGVSVGVGAELGPDLDGHARSLLSSELGTASGELAALGEEAHALLLAIQVV